ncbi:ERI1 exoribonuclease 3 [Cataglyphis hispanica]|uniref:ERI1 exoribonuclease 3 n=1 Tax=Cataglyphis hispanica TaxID=1086592 RepID=UPI00217F7CAF|nr:ERI1 exoribonuclease 3 [Cataglyphis hispanica]XP_050446608.1 ERI1 exoribonuclease 3 [Cataglyphis hispanica]XP_050446609.1 ERI1 exoribonuclease 3 [Cataglyphis hispanica]
MAHRILRRYPRTTVNHFLEVVQKFEYLLVMDFEATCDRHTVLKPQEIIELPCVSLSTNDWKIKDTFHAYIKPRIYPKLTPFCTELTGIMQEMVDNQPCFADVFSRFREWLIEGKYFENTDKSSFVTCGNWDLKVMLPNQCNLDNITLPDEFKQWIELKHTFCDSTGYYPRSLKDMLVRLDLPLQGRLHSGIDDVKNIVSIIQALKEKYNTQFKITSSLTSSTLGLSNHERSSITI